MNKFTANEIKDLVNSNFSEVNALGYNSLVEELTAINDENGKDRVLAHIEYLQEEVFADNARSEYFN